MSKNSINMTYTTDDVPSSPDEISNWTVLHSVASIHGSNNTTSVAAPNDEVDNLRYGMTTTIILM